VKRADEKLSPIGSMSQQCIAVRIRLLSRMVTSIYDSALSPFGVKLNQISILVFVHLAGEVGYDVLCRRLKMEKSTASRNIDRMKRKGWLNIVSAKGERRKFLKITLAGEALLGNVHAVWEDAQKKALKLLGEEGAEVLCGIANGIWKKDKER
jgi:DNA-binding MarR family transcriptional regulator